MSFLRKGQRRRGRMAALTTVGALFAFQALAIVGAGVASAVTACTYNPATDTINITIDPNEIVGLAVEGTSDLDPAADPGAILANLNGAGFAACGSATNSNTVAIVVLGSPGNNEALAINNNVGGGGDTGEFNTAIAWSIDLGTGTSDLLAFHLGNGDDVLTVTNDSFTLNGGGAAAGDLLGVELLRVDAEEGDDTIDASASAILAGAGGHLAGGEDDDVISPGTAAGDVVSGSSGDDTVSYATRTTTIAVENAGDAGTDANADGDSSDVGDEGDILNGCFEVIVTGSGNDTIDNALCGSTTFAPGPGDDDIVNDNSSDTLDLSSSTGPVVIDTDGQTATGQGTDTWESLENFIGSDFDDTLLVDDDAPGPDVDSFSGGGGVDTVNASAATAGVFIDIDILDPNGADDLENIIGSPFSDELDGNDLRNEIFAGDGDDFLSGDEGNDTFFGEGGNDTFQGNEGADTVNFRNSPNGVTVDLSLLFATGEGDDSFDDTIEIVVGSNFNDSITGGPFSGGGTVNFLFKGRAGADVLTGFAGNDTLKAAGGNDVVRGGGGDDTLAGGGGNDTLAGGKGFDIGKGGKGDDVCKGVEQKTSCGSANNPA